MDVAQIQMPPEAARKAFEQYRRLVKKRARAEDIALRAAYEELAKGHTVINLVEALQKAGVGADGYPRLAIAPAQRVEWVWFDYRTRTGGSFFWHPDALWRGYRNYRYDVPAGTFPEGSTTAGNGRRRAMVPTIPPQYRPARYLKSHFLLWEAIWLQTAPVDPMLLKRITGHLFAVLAAWDLSEIERLVLGAVRNGVA